VEECPVEVIANVGAGCNEFVEERLDRWDDAATLCLLQYTQAAEVFDPVVSRCASGFTLINQEGTALFFCEGKRFAFAKVEFVRELVNKRTIVDANACDPHRVSHCFHSRFACTVDDNVFVHGVRDHQHPNDVPQEIETMRAYEGQNRA